jgi:cyclopropane fatty-acyl-phospholipid synthase-like methyltransferase
MEYAEIFRHRGHLYDQAMCEFPDARRTELASVFAAAPLAGRESVLDVPAGGGYLRRILPPAVQLTELEVSEGFETDLRVVPTYGPWPVGRFDRCVCLAASHHIADKPRFLGLLRQHLNANGLVHLADVDARFPQARFLDGFVGCYNGTGHDGLYLDEGLPQLAAAAGLRIVRDEAIDTAWRFASEADGIRFVGLLFGIRDFPPEALRQELLRLGWQAQGADWVLPWPLRYVDLRSL